MLLRVCLVLCIVIAPFQILGPLGLREEGYGAVAWGWLQAVFSAGMIVGMAIAMRYRPKRPMITVTLTGSTAVGGAAGARHLRRPVGARRRLRACAASPSASSSRCGTRRCRRRSPRSRWAASRRGTGCRRSRCGRLGLAVAGPLAERFGVTTMCWVTGILGLLAAFWVLLVKDVWRLRPAAVLAGEAGPPAPPAARRRPHERVVEAAARAARPAAAGRGAALASGRALLLATPAAAGVQQDVQDDPGGEHDGPPALQPAERVLRRSRRRWWCTARRSSR